MEMTADRDLEAGGDPPADHHPPRLRQGSAGRRGRSICSSSTRPTSTSSSTSWRKMRVAPRSHVHERADRRQHRLGVASRSPSATPQRWRSLRAGAPRRPRWRRRRIRLRGQRLSGYGQEPPRSKASAAHLDGDRPGDGSLIRTITQDDVAQVRRADRRRQPAPRRCRVRRGVAVQGHRRARDARRVVPVHAHRDAAPGGGAVWVSPRRSTSVIPIRLDDTLTVTGTVTKTHDRDRSLDWSCPHRESEGRARS